MRLLLVLFPLLAAADPLPREITPQPAVLEAQPDDEGRKVWHTRFFRIDSDLEIRRNELLKLSQVADTTAMVVKNYPLPLFAPPEGLRSRIAIYADPFAYAEAGGFPGTAGFYIARRALVLVRGDMLVKAPDPAHRLAAANDEDLVVHELVHLCMHRVNSRMPQWFLEGISEYFACAHSGGGRFSFADMDKAVREHLRSRLSPDDPRVPLLPVAEIAGLDNRGWLRYVAGLPEERRYQAYATALLLAHYHLNGGAERLATLRKALEKDARPKRDAPSIIAPDTAPEIQAALLRYWKKKGLSLEFAPSV